MDKKILVCLILGTMFILCIGFVTNLDFSKEHTINYSPYQGEVVKVPANLNGVGPGYVVIPTTLLPESIKKQLRDSGEI